MDIEKLYQDVWAQVFAQVWVASGCDDGKARDNADEAAADAVNLWSHDKARSAIAAKGQG